MKYVIIGNSTAGIGAVEGIRKVDRQGEITVITNETHHTYSRPLISYLLLGKVTEEKMKYRGDSFYKDNNVSLVAGVNVLKIDAEKKRLDLSDGSAVDYDKLLVAAGSSPFVPPFEGLDTVENKTSFMSLDDARKLEGMISSCGDVSGAKVLIIGAGLIGLKCAEGLSSLGEISGAKKVSKITVADLAPRILSSILDEEGAALVRKHMESKGIEFKLADSVKKFEKNSAVFEGGAVVNFDALVLAVGVRPNTALLKDIAQIDRGIVVNGKSETSAKDIYAAGDCTQTLDISSGQSKIMALLPNAYMQGECAGINMAAGEKSFDAAIPMNAIGFFGLHMITAGNYSGETYVKKDQDNYRKLFYGENKMNGYILIGNVEKAGIYTSLIRERTPLDTIDFALVSEKPGLMAFTKEERTAKLG